MMLALYVARKERKDSGGKGNSLKTLLYFKEIVS